MGSRSLSLRWRKLGDFLFTKQNTHQSENNSDINAMYIFFAEGDMLIMDGV